MECVFSWGEITALFIFHYEPTYFNEFLSPEAHSPEGLREKRRSCEKQ